METKKSIILRDGIFLSFHDDKNDCSYSGVIKPLKDFLKKFKIPTYCMRDSDDSFSTGSGENYVSKEIEFILNKTLIFVALINNEYFESAECVREIELIKNVIKKSRSSLDEPRIIFIYDYDNDDIIRDIQSTIVGQSWYDSSIFNDKHIYLKAKEIEETKMGILQAYCDKLPKAFEFYTKQIEESLNKKYESSHLMSDLVLHSLKQTYVCTTVSKYILQSHELTDKRSGYEMHIITDEIKNYDMTVLSSMAIALNLQKNVKYIYYGSPETKELFGKLREVIATFIVKNDASRRKVDRYIRYTFDCQSNLSLIVAELDNLRYEEFLNAFPKKEEILRKYKTDFFSAGKFKEVSNIICWLRGRKSNTEIGKDGYNYQYIERFNSFLKEILVDEISNTNYIAVYFKKIADDFNNLVRFSNWNVGSNSLAKESLDRVEILELEDALRVHEEFRDWIGYCENEGEANISHEEVEQILDGMHFITLDDHNDDLPLITYSFCIFYEQNYDQYDIYSAWYRTASGVGSIPSKFQKQENFSLKTERDIDNDLVMYTSNETDNEQYLRMFYRFLKSSDSIRKQLESIGSSLFKTLNNFYGTGSEK